MDLTRRELLRLASSGAAGAAGLAMTLGAE